LGKVDLSKELAFLAFGERIELCLVWEVEEDIGKLHVSMDDIVRLYIFNTLHELFQDSSCLVLTQVAPLLEEHRKVEAVCILLDHVDLIGRLDRLKVPD